MPNVVQQASNSAAGTSVTVTLGAPTSGGTCLIVGVLTTGVSNNGTVSGITLGASADNFGVLATEGTGADHAIVTYWADPQAAAGQTSVVISTTGSSGSAAISATVYEVSGMPASIAGMLDKSAVFTSSGFVTSWTLGPTATTTSPSQVWFAIIGGNVTGATGGTLSGPGSLWNNTGMPPVNNYDGSHSQNGLTGYQVVSATGTASYNGTASITSTLDGLVIALNAAVIQPVIPSRPGPTLKRQLQRRQVLLSAPSAVGGGSANVTGVGASVSVNAGLGAVAADQNIPGAGAAIAPDTTGNTPVTTGATSASVDITAAATGSWVYLWCAISTGTTTQSGVPSNGSWTTLQSTQTTAGTSGACYALYRRQKQAGDTTFSFGWTTSAKGVFVWQSYTGLDGTTPDEGSAITQNDVTSRSAVPSPSGTPTTATRWALACFGVRTTNTSNKSIDWTPDAATTERADVNNSAAASSPWIGAEMADTNGTVTQVSHSYTATHNVSGVATSESHDGSAILFLIPAANVTGAQVTTAGGIGTPSGSASVTGVGASVATAGGIGTPAGGANITGTGAQVAAAAGTGTPSGGASVAGVGAQISVAAGVGSPSASDVVTGVGSQVAVAGGIGTPSGSASIAGVGAQVAVAGGVGTPSGAAGVTGTGAAVPVAGGVGSPSGSASVTGVGAQVPVGAGIGIPSAGGSVNVTGVGAQVTTAAGTGTASAGAGIAGSGAAVAVAGGIGVPSGSAGVTGVGAQVTAAAGAGVLHGGVSITGVGAQVTVGAGTGVPSAGGSVNISGIGALVTTAAGVGALAASANVAGIGALIALAAGTGTPAGVINGAANVTGVGAVVSVFGGAGTVTGGTVIVIDATRAIAFQARTSVAATAAAGFNAGRPVQAGLVTLASDAWISMYPDTL